MSRRYHAELLAVLSLGCVGDTPVVTPCVLGTADCGGQCVELTTSPDHCGACGIACDPGQRCEGGRCTCTASLCGDQCVDTERSPAHCGACGEACDEGLACEGGACVAQCQGGLDSCGGTCVDVGTAREHCGACGQRCPSGADCFDGDCRCRDGLEACGDGCVDLATDADHCGACEQACGEGDTCTGERCTLACGPGPCAPSEFAFSRSLPSQAAPVIVGDVVTLADGGSVVAGTFEGELDLGAQALVALGADVFVARYDPRGQPRWVRRFGAEGVTATVGGIDADGDRIVVVGSVDGDVTIDTTEHMSDGVDALVVELDHDGMVLASEVFGGPGVQRLTAVRALGTGWAWGGNFTDQLDLDGGSMASSDGPGDQDAFVLVRDLGGATAWFATAHDPGAEAPQAIEGLGRGPGVTAAIESAGPAQVGGEIIGDVNPSASLVAWDVMGTVQWSFVASSDEEVHTPRVSPDGAWVALTHRGGLALQGACSPLDLPGAIDQDAVVLTVDGDGCPSNPARFGGPGDQTIAALAAGATVVVAGRFDQQVDVAGVPLATGEAGEMFVAALGASEWLTTGATQACATQECGVAIHGGRAYVATTFRGSARREPSSLASTGGEGDGFLGLLALGLPPP